ncbi:MAG: phosphoglycerate kinase [Candidatus Thermoplasmatota archaeon]|nr:phosphoglycerate kinase [Candidatus Thermoplasmatota archaeon]
MPYPGEEYFTLDDFDLRGKTVLLRVDINSPLDPESGRILDDHRIKSHIDTIRDLGDTRLIIVAHQSRPGKNDYTSLEPHAERLSQLLRKEVEYVDGLFEKHALKKIREMRRGDILLLENARFFAEETYLKGESDWEKHENTHIVKKLSQEIDFFVHDAFAAAHRAQPTLVGFSSVVPCMAGRVMESELKNMGKAFTMDRSPKLAFLGGMKADDSIEVAEHMLSGGKIDKILTGGVTANIFLMASGHDLGEGNREFLEDELPGYEKIVEDAEELLEKWPDRIKLPKDVVLNEEGERNGIPLDALPSDHPIFDIGLDTIMEYRKEIEDASLVVLNGPAGAFEIDDFSIGTTEIFKAIAHSNAYSIIGGGHSTAVLENLDLEDEIDHISTGGGSCINFLAGKKLSGVKALNRSYREFKKESI